ncbi:hypothetical protein F5Y08DRAFT_268451 [Xylaria arbuscula]|nr:hypothetical protein F5Y08DRAFT_268451 [Xylaria arbuscula]
MRMRWYGSGRGQQRTGQAGAGWRRVVLESAFCLLSPGATGCSDAFCGLGSGAPPHQTETPDAQPGQLDLGLPPVLSGPGGSGQGTGASLVAALVYPRSAWPLSGPCIDSRAALCRRPLQKHLWPRITLSPTYEVARCASFCDLKLAVLFP